MFVALCEQVYTSVTICYLQVCREQRLEVQVMFTQHGVEMDIQYGSVKTWFTPDIQGSMGEHKMTDTRFSGNPKSKQ